MIVAGVSRKEIIRIADEIDLWPEWFHRDDAADGELEFDLRPKADRFRAFGLRGKNTFNDRTKARHRVYIVCFHGHEEFIGRLFAAHPAATVITVLQTYEGKADFDLVQPAVADRWRRKYSHSVKCLCP